MQRCRHQFPTVTQPLAPPRCLPASRTFRNRRFLDLVRVWHFGHTVCLSSFWSEWRLCELTSAQRGCGESDPTRHCKHDGLWPLAATFLARWCRFTARPFGWFFQRGRFLQRGSCLREARPRAPNLTTRDSKAQHHFDGPLKIDWGDASMGKFGTSDPFEKKNQKTKPWGQG